MSLGGTLADSGRKLLKSQNYHKISAIFGIETLKLNRNKYFLRVIGDSHCNTPDSRIRREKYAKILNIEDKDLIDLQDKVNLKVQKINGKYTIVFSSVDFARSNNVLSFQKLINEHDKIRKDKLKIITDFIKEKNIDMVIPDYFYHNLIFDVSHDYTQEEVPYVPRQGYRNNYQPKQKNENNKRELQNESELEQS